ncbi:hypothetical protein OYE22_10905 [Streptomyces sp. 71268]|uniref:hypothetical protein n=1 Tax=Streptomyces sp. 71268 TaxID=3002640 RepID=UPI0023F87B77|nr:hypothetical protein [Streptomyces sp. 71268]WEV25648.1 hypothetical protein OYE22_10905 [Streptomyces sp. 71268]
MGEVRLDKLMASLRADLQVVQAIYGVLLSAVADPIPVDLMQALAKRLESAGASAKAVLDRLEEMESIAQRFAAQSVAETARASHPDPRVESEGKGEEPTGGEPWWLP